MKFYNTFILLVINLLLVYCDNTNEQSKSQVIEAGNTINIYDEDKELGISKKIIGEYKDISYVIMDQDCSYNIRLDSAGNLMAVQQRSNDEKDGVQLFFRIGNEMFKNVEYWQSGKLIKRITYSDTSFNPVDEFVFKE